MSFVPQAWQWRTALTVRSWLWPLWTVRSLSGTRTRPHKTAPLLDDTTCRQAARRRIKSQPSSPPRASEWMGFEPQVWFHWFKSSCLMWLFFFFCLSLRSFTSLCYSADGESVLAGGQAKFVCIYNIKEQMLIKKFEISCNLSFDAMEVRPHSLLSIHI